MDNGNGIKFSESILKLGQSRSFKPEGFLFHCGDKAEGFYYIVCGEVRVYSTDPEGRDVEISRFEAGDFIGEAIVFSTRVFPITARAVKETETIYFPRNVINKAIEKNPETAIFFIKLLAAKCLMLNQRIEVLNLKTVRQRLAQYILKQCPGDHRCTISLPDKKIELARRLGTISETLSRNLKSLQEDNLIRVEGKDIHILDCLRLRQELM